MIKNYGDVRQGAMCIHCGSTKGSRDHVPSKVFLEKPFPDNLTTIDICAACNQSFAADEEYTACFIECALTGSTDSSVIQRSRISRALENNPDLRAGIEASRSVSFEQDGSPVKIWKPDLKRVENAIVKNARGHALHELNEAPYGNPSSVKFWPIHKFSLEERMAFLNGPETCIWPEVGSRSMQRLLTGEGLEAGWLIVQEGMYRFAVAVGGWIQVRIIIRDYLACEVLWED